MLPTIVNNEVIKAKPSEIWLENFYIQSNRHLYLLNWNNANQISNLTLRRLIDDNKFILEFDYANFDQAISDIKIDALINNNEIKIEKKLTSQKNRFIFSVISEKTKDLSSMTFDKIKSINFEISYLVKNKWYQVERFEYRINAIKENKVIKTNLNGTFINLMTTLNVKSIPVYNKPTLIRHHESREYISFYFKPKKFLIGLPIKEIFEFNIFKVNSNGQKDLVVNQSDVFGLNIEAKIPTEQVNGTISVLYNPWETNNKNILIDSYSYYDRKQGITFITPNHYEAKKGLMIPLKFQGNFFIQINISFGSKLKDFSVIYNEELAKPFFNLSNGLIQLKTQQINGYLTEEKYNVIKLKNIQKIISNANSINDINYLGKE
ncbi:MHO_1580 family protein [Mycoplasma struthionis]|uniref:Uncharacterized protein n=1 Tax=Mycoplasma struthionis TaxID=538220 RepID=A0A3G8LHH9_9MOLU|nr:hypothetical protein [Mycoplasma struthionis]AZG68804.1 hypothetical protein EGN60_02465 [Mycoplasma struthionis]TPI01577.1 hypothetical protein FJM01_02350 [Mycoplasma struthionis]